MQFPIPETVRGKGPQQFGEWKVGDRLMDRGGELATIWWFYDCPTAYVKWDNGCYGSIDMDDFPDRFVRAPVDGAGPQEPVEQ